MIDHIVLIIVLVFVGWKAREITARYQLVKLLETMQEDERQASKISTISVVITKEKGIFIVHNKDTDEFLGQGNSEQEVRKVLKERYPRVIFLATGENLDEVGFKQ